MAEDTRHRPDHSSDSYSPKSSWDSKPSWETSSRETSPREPSSDPLTELARLIGQNDPFADLKAHGTARKPLDSFRAGDRPAPEWLARPAPQDGDDQYDEPRTSRDDYGARRRADPYDTPAGYDAQDDRGYTPPRARDQGYAQYGTQHPERYDEADAEPAYDSYNGARQPAAGSAYDAGDNRYRVALPAADDYEADYYAEDGHMPPQEEGAVPSRKRGGLLTIAAVLGLAVIGTAGAFGYRAFTSGSGTGGTPPVIKADTTPAKTVPPAAAANTDAQGKPFQDRIAAMTTPERVVPREEQPVPVPVAPQMTAPQSRQVAAPLIPPAPPPSAATANEPKRVRTVTIRPDGDTTASAPIQPPPGPAGATRSIAPQNARQAAPSGPMTIAPQSDANARTKVATRSAAPIPSGAYVVQVSAQKTEAEAQSSYQALQSKYPSVLGGREASIRRADLGDKGVYYRAQIGPFATYDQANTFCNNLKAAGGQCIAQKN